MSPLPRPENCVLETDSDDISDALLSVWWSVALAHGAQPFAPGHGTLTLDMNGVLRPGADKVSFSVALWFRFEPVAPDVLEARPGLGDFIRSSCAQFAEIEPKARRNTVSGNTFVSHHQMLRLCGEFADRLWLPDAPTEAP